MQNESFFHNAIVALLFPTLAVFMVLVIFYFLFC